MSRTAFDEPGFKLNEQQEAVLDFMSHNYSNDAEKGEWYTAYDLHKGIGYIKSGKGVVIGDAGRRMRELREEGILESRKRGRFEEYRLVQRTIEPKIELIDPHNFTPSQNRQYMETLKYGITPTGRLF